MTPLHVFTLTLAALGWIMMELLYLIQFISEPGGNDLKFLDYKWQRLHLASMLFFISIAWLILAVMQLVAPNSSSDEKEGEKLRDA